MDFTESIYVLRGNCPYRGEEIEMKTRLVTGEYIEPCPNCLYRLKVKVNECELKGFEPVDEGVKMKKSLEDFM